MSARDSRQVRELVNDLASLGSAPTQPTLRKEEPRGGIPAARGYAERAYQPGNDTGTAGIASPITEPDPALREYYPGGLRSSDGLFTLPAIKKLVLEDAQGAQVIVELGLPTGTAG